MVYLLLNWSFFAALLMALITGCSQPAAVESTPVPTITPTPAPAVDDTLFGPVNSWESVSPGLERRRYLPSDNALTQMIALRIDPAQFSFRVHYQPAQPLTAQQWIEALPDAVAIINANFFTRDNTALGLVVADGIAHGQSYVDQGGMFAVQDGLPRVQNLILQPYDGSPLEQAVQAFPNLVTDGSPAPITSPNDRITRRSVIGQDQAGRIILLATPFLGLELIPLADYLAAADLDLTTAFNLDGGGSTLLVAPVDGSPQVLVTSFDPVPVVLAVYPR
ncbi:MAG TPA: phosphodiester glycosidase family protein [Aggregatilineales bacterium]|nr:phosphodiester glycosidase family protein [Aggregatilineales bacterium]